MDDIVRELQWAALTVAWVASGSFVVLYHLRTSWWRWPIGRMMMSSKTMMFTILSLSLAVRVLGDYPGRQLALLAAFAGFALTMTWQVITLWRETAEPFDMQAPQRSVTESERSR